MRWETQDWDGELAHDDGGIGEAGARQNHVPPPEGWEIHDPGASGSSGSSRAGPCCVWMGLAAASMVVDIWQ